jgi:PAS domain S-box-containing protein
MTKVTIMSRELHSAFNSSKIGAWTWEIVSNSMTWDDHGTPLLGLKPDAFPRRYEDFVSVISPEDRERVAREITKSVEGQAPFETELQVVWPDHSVHVLGVRGTVHRDEAGRPLRMVGTCWAICEGKGTQENRDHLASLVEGADDAIIGKTLDGIIISWNKGAEQVYGYLSKEVIGKAISVLLPPGRADELPEIVRRLSRGESIGHYETLRQRKDGRVIDISLTISPIKNMRGHLTGASSIARDITEHKHLREILQAKNVELENASLIKDRFLASMSHELRTPLNAIIGFTGTLMMKLPGPLTDEQSKQLRTIQSSAKHLLSLINDLLDVAKIESGKLALTIEPVIFQSVVEDVCTTLRPLAEQKGLDLKVTVPEGQLVLNTDRRALSQILMNLISNAIKFTERGEVCIVLDRQTHNRKSWTQVSVHDTRIGIRPEDQPKLFEPFSQVVERNTSRRNRHEGTGLGLQLSQKLAALLGGQINFKSEYGNGSTFTLSVPENIKGG